MSKGFNHNRESRVGEWHCVVQQEPWNLITRVYLLKHTGPGKGEIATVEKGKIILTPIKDGSEYSAKPLLIVPFDAWQAVLGALGSIEPDLKREVIDAELQATKYHLSDMRKLVFKEVN